MGPDDEKKSDAPAEETSPSPAAALLSHDVAAISLSLRVPPFWRDQPILWFCSFEAATAELKRSQAQLAQMVIAQLEKQDIQNISDLIYSPPEENYYTVIKNRLISVYEESNSAQTKKLLSQVELGEQKPSQLLRRMKTLNKEKFPETTIQMMWLDHLPPHIRSVLTVSEAFKIKTTLEDLALLADKMLEHTLTSSHQIAAVSSPAVLPPSLLPPPPPQPSTSALDTQYLIGEIRRLSLEPLKPPFPITFTEPISRPKPTKPQKLADAVLPLPPSIWYGRPEMCTAVQFQTNPGNSDIGKLSVTLAAAETGVTTKSHRLFVRDRATKLVFLVDTGANISVLPRTPGTKAQALPFQLYAANNTVIPTYGEKTLELDLNLRRPFRWKFIIAAVSKPIIGADFLAYHYIIVDITRRRLIDGKTLLYTDAQLCTANIPTVRSIDVKQSYHNILADYPGTTRLTSMKLSPKHNVEHFIETTGPPLHCRPRPIAPHRYELVKKEFANMMEQGLCRPSKSPWASPLHVVPKKNGELRVCGDYRRLNAITKPDRYPIPRIRDFTYQLAGKQTFSTLDLNRAYQQLPIAAQDVEKSAIITPFGLFEFPRMCPGLKNCGQTFQRFIHEVLRDLDFVFPFVDDLLVASSDEATHEKHLRAILSRLEDYGITINPSKCVFGQPSVKFLGYEVSKDGIRPPTEKVQAIIDYPKPKNIDELRRFLGMLNFYRENIKNAAQIQAPLCKYLHNAKKRDKTEISWDGEADEAFDACKASIQNAALLAHPSHHAPLAIFSDASDKAAGASLNQFINDTWQPLGYFSKKFSDAQTRYSTFDRELLAIYLSTKHFRKMFEGRELIIFTDHKPLTYAFTKTSNNNESPRRTRQLLYISEFTTDIRHIPGTQNAAADALSRIEAIASPSPIDYEQLSRAQERDSDTIRSLAQQDNLSMKQVTIPGTTVKLYCETSTPHLRPYVPEEHRRAAFNAVHNISHPGIKTSRKLVAQRYFWPGLNADVGKWAKVCVHCQRAKIQRHTTSPISSFPPTTRFEHIHIDLVGPLPTTASGHRYLLTMIDRSTRWPEAIPLCEITAEEVAKALYEGWISRFGCPATITTDQGRQFESRVFASLTRLLGVERTRTTPYHAQANGICERFHRSLKAALKARLQIERSWIDIIPSVLLGLRAALRTDTGVSPALLTYGCSVRLPGELLTPTREDVTMDSDFVEKLRATIQSLTPTAMIPHGNKKPIFVHRDLQTCEQVFVRVDAVKKPLQAPYDGPYRVLKRNDKVFTLQLPNRQLNISIDRLKPAFIIADTEQEIPTTTSTTDIPTTTSSTKTPNITTTTIATKIPTATTTSIPTATTSNKTTQPIVSPSLPTSQQNNNNQQQKKGILKRRNEPDTTTTTQVPTSTSTTRRGRTIRLPVRFA
ncbi:retrovirus-related Pol polyprotein from transposon 412 [Cydia amplana]|uniref:retrovirus-related Pol polyprotein from transposon 412 n=1 Tax=Cydia amplana TaxID=1869771 RepID=UPI002FE58D42